MVAGTATGRIRTQPRISGTHLQKGCDRNAQACIQDRQQNRTTHEKRFPFPEVANLPSRDKAHIQPKERLYAIEHLASEGFQAFPPLLAAIQTHAQTAHQQKN